MLYYCCCYSKNMSLGWECRFLRFLLFTCVVHTQKLELSCCWYICTFCQAWMIMMPQCVHMPVSILCFPPWEKFSFGNKILAQGCGTFLQTKVYILFWATFGRLDASDQDGVVAVGTEQRYEWAEQQLLTIHLHNSLHTPSSLQPDRQEALSELNDTF